MKENLITDIDGVLENLIPNLNDFYNNHYGTNFKLEDYIYYDLEKIWGGSKRRAVEIVTEFYKSPRFDEINPIKFSQEAIKILSREYNIIAVTSRPEFTKERTEKRINQIYPAIQEILFTGDYRKKFTDMSKLDICLKKGAKIIVDDHPLIVKECAENGLVSLLFGEVVYSHNHGNLNGVIPVKNWKEVLNYLGIKN